MEDKKVKGRVQAPEERVKNFNEVELGSTPAVITEENRSLFSPLSWSIILE